MSHKLMRLYDVESYESLKLKIFIHSEVFIFYFTDVANASTLKESLKSCDAICQALF